MELDPPIVNGTTIIDSLRVISDVDKSPMSNGPNNEDFADDDEDNYENNNMEDEEVPPVGQESTSVTFYGEKMQNFGSFQNMSLREPI